MPNAPLNIDISSRRSRKNYTAAIWPNESDDHVKTRRLSRAVRTEQAYDFAARAH